MNDHISEVLSALEVVGNSKHVGGVGGEVQRQLWQWISLWRPYLLGGHGVFAVIPDCIVVIVIVVLVRILVVVLDDVLFTVFERKREGNMLDNLDIIMKYKTRNLPALHLLALLCSVSRSREDAKLQQLRQKCLLTR